MTTIKLGSVVVGTDGSPPGEGAVTWAVGYARVMNRPLVIVSAGGSLKPADWPTKQAEARHQGRIVARRAGDRALGLAQRAAPGLDVSALTLRGNAPEELVALSDQASMLVVGTRGNGPVTSLVLGSVSVLAATRARCPVAVVRPPVPERSGVVVGVSADGSDSAAIEFAATLAEAGGGPLDAVHASGPAGDDQRRAMETALSSLSEKHPDVQVNRHFPDARPLAALVDWSQRREVVVVGSRARTSTVALLGSVSRALIEHAHSTVVVVRP